MRLLHLYRPRVPSVRAQAVQVVHTCVALASRGHEVTLLADRVAGDTTDPDVALAAYQLDRPPGLALEIAPTPWPPGAGLWFRWQLAAWCRRPGVVYARAKRYVRRIPAEIPVFLEVHEVDSALDREAGRDPLKNLSLEAAVLGRARGVVANCGGTLALLRATWPGMPVGTVIHNATRADRACPRAPSPTPLVGYTGSPRAYKGIRTVLESVALWPSGVTLEMVGGAPEGELPPGVRAIPAVPYGALPAHLSRYHALLLPLDDNLFGRSLTSPLKLWDYLATGIPIVAADLPTTREIGGDTLHYYRPGDRDDLARAVREALLAPPPAPRLRTWDERAAEIEAFLLANLGLEHL